VNYEANFCFFILQMIAMQVDDRVGEILACNNLGFCHMHLQEYANAVAYYRRQYSISTELGLGHKQAKAAMGIGVALALQVRADRRGGGGEEGPVVGACRGPGPDSDTSVTSHKSHTSVTSHTSSTSATWASGPLTRDVEAERFLADV
jgi:hypothetical protein